MGFILTFLYVCVHVNYVNYIKYEAWNLGIELQI